MPVPVCTTITAPPVWTPSLSAIITFSLLPGLALPTADGQHGRAGAAVVKDIAKIAREDAAGQILSIQIEGPINR